MDGLGVLGGAGVAVLLMLLVFASLLSSCVAGVSMTCVDDVTAA